MSWQPEGGDQSGWQPDGWQPGETGPSFIGPSIANLALQLNAAMAARDYSDRFSGSNLTFTAGGSLPAGLSLSSAGVLTGTPTVLGMTSGLRIQATDGENTAQSNEFSISVVNITIYAPARATLRVPPRVRSIRA